PGLLAVGVVEQDEASRGLHVAGPGGLTAQCVGPGGESLRSLDRFEAHLRPRPQGLQRGDGVAELLRRLGHRGHPATVRRPVGRGRQDAPTEGRRTGRGTMNVMTAPFSPSTAPEGARRSLPDAPLLVAARGGVPSRVPVWFMRQAGRSLPEYRSVREGVPMLQACFDPGLLTEITMQPVRRHGVDAAILFSDIVVPLYAAGLGIDIVPGTGPVVAHPVRTAADVDALPELTVEQVAPVAEGVSMLVRELGETPLIGFAGAPFTLASYLIEGGPSRNHEHTKALMHAEPELWHRLAARLAD